MPATVMLVGALLLGFPASTAAHSADAVGGGFADSGVLGAYYANTELEGAPAFTRRDVRIDFDWGDTLPVGGSSAEPFRSFPTDRFSVRWTGRILARFGEPYTFVGEADDGIRIKLKKPDDSEWTILVDRWSEPGAFESIPAQLVAGQPYDIEVEYRETKGNARCIVSWQSPSTPREVIDPVTQQALNAASFVSYIWADLMKTARYGAQRESVDDHGWPTRNGTELIMMEMSSEDRELSGTYLIRFKGQAQLRQACCGNPPLFRAGGAQFERTLPAGAGYDSSSNTTSATMKARGSRTMLFFENASRGGESRRAGVTQIKLMRPLAPGSDQHHASDEIVYRPFKAIVQDNFTAVRWLEGANEKTEKEWSGRALPGDAFFQSSLGQENWEYLVMLANETGEDLYLTTPIAADDAYFEKLALLLRYGSDGKEPYRESTPNPIYPPLNPNLRVYVEVGNEIWNWVFGSTSLAQSLAAGEAERDSSTWAAMSYDGDVGEANGIRAVRRWHALRTVACSNAFRRVWGDEAMGPRVRMLLEYQYDNFQRTASSSLHFLDEYFGNRTKANVIDPHPPSYYLWGAGGATYYGLANKTGVQTHTVVRDPSFEAPAIASKSRVLTPSGSAWAFKGTAGVVRPTGDGRIKELDEPAKPKSGRQAAFILGNGSIAQRIRFAKPGNYAIAFNAAGSGDGWPGHLRFDIYVDEVKVSPRSQSDIRIAEDRWNLRGWTREIDSLEEEWGSAVFRIDRPGERTIRFVGRGGKDYVLLDDIRISSADAILESGFDAGEAEGQVGDSNLAKQFRQQSKYARTFGLQVVAYEAGWSVGGDFHQIPLQNWCKLKDDRARKINDRMIDLWDESGSFMNVWGVYRYWPNYDLAHAATYPIMRSLNAASRSLRREATYGQTLPATLRTKDADWKHVSKGAGNASWWLRYLPWADKSGGSEWFSWMLIAPSTREYSIQVRAEGEGSLVVEVDGEAAMRFEPVSPPLAPLRLRLTKGAHAIRVVITGDVELQSVDISP
ncbi:MAG: PA14 domain-containing protein [Myxococcales bacterium]|nr:PA14 domain-containing protein [Myxococcales bacterium]